MIKKSDKKNRLTKVLLIDDEAPFCDLVKMNLEISGRFRVITSRDGRSGIKTAREILPDIILLDIMMPGMDGFQLLEILRKDPKTALIPVIIVSASSQDAVRAKAKSLGCQYIAKPVNTADLISRIEDTLK